MTTIGNYPYLEYTIVPSPLIVNQKRDIIVLATLKTTVQNGAPLSSVTVKNIVLDFGGTGSGATDLTTTSDAITTANFKPNLNWSITKGEASGMSFKVSPSSTNVSNGQITDNAIMIKINGVDVNDTPGNVTVTITETVSKVNGETNQESNYDSLVLPKIDGQGTVKTTFTSNHQYINTGNQQDVKLSWKGPASSAYSLHYLDQDQLVNVPVKNADGKEGNLGNNGSYKLYPPGTSITPSNTEGFMPEETTDFILRIRDSSPNPTYMTLTVIVEGSDIYVKDATITNDLTVKKMLKANKAVINDASPWLDFNVGGRAFFESGEISTIDTFEFKRKNSEGDRTLMGSLDKSKLKINGDIEATGYISSTQDIITDKTLKGLGGWGATKANWSTGYEASTGGQTFEGVSGFSLSNGKNSYGYYWLDLGGVKEGTLIVDMYIASNNTNDVAFFNIQSSTKPLNSSGQFPDVTCSREIWSSSYQAPSWSNSWNGAYMTRKLIRTPFYGRYIYIGVLQLEGGQQGIAIRKVTAQAPT